MILNMHNYYIINEVIEFHPATSTLRDIYNPGNVVALHSPAGRCLLLLITRLGEVVTQKEFMDFVWRQRGLMVTSNTYYQSISVLRKGLKRIGLEDDIIVTIPRIGLTLASATRIRKLSTDKGIETSEFIHKETINPINEILTVSEQDEKSSSRSSQRLHFSEIRIAKNRRVTGFVLIFLFVFLCAFLFL